MYKPILIFVVMLGSFMNVSGQLLMERLHDEVVRDKKIKTETVYRTKTVQAFHITNKERNAAPATQNVDHITEYDEQGRMKKLTHNFSTYPNGVKTFFVYDDRGNVIEKFDSAETSIVRRNIYRYDKANNPVEYELCDTNFNIIYKRVTEYDTNHNPIFERRFDEKGNVVYQNKSTFNNFGRLIKEEVEDDGKKYQDVEYAYSKDTILYKVIYTNYDSSLNVSLKRNFIYTYDGSGLLKSISEYDRNNKKIAEEKIISLSDEDKLTRDGYNGLIISEQFVNGDYIIHHKYLYDKYKRVEREKVWYEYGRLRKEIRLKSVYSIPVIAGGAELDVQNSTPATAEFNYSYEESGLIGKFYVIMYGRVDQNEGIAFPGAEYTFSLEYTFW
jgi:hypothetical protein